MATIDQEIAKLLHRLPEAQQQRVLDFARELADVDPRGRRGPDHRDPRRSAAERPELG